MSDVRARAPSREGEVSEARRAPERSPSADADRGSPRPNAKAPRTPRILSVLVTLVVAAVAAFAVWLLWQGLYGATLDA